VDSAVVHFFACAHFKRRTIARRTAVTLIGSLSGVQSQKRILHQTDARWGPRMWKTYYTAGGIVGRARLNGASEAANRREYTPSFRVALIATYLGTNLPYC